VLKGLSGCWVRIDDILVSGEADEIHLRNLHRVLQRLHEFGLKLNPDMFHFMLDQVVYLGTTISAEGISPTKERVKTIREAEVTTNVPEMQSFLGSASFLRKFAPDFARIASRLYQLICKETSWKWEIMEQEPQSHLCSDSILRLYDPASKLILQCDGFSVGVGATPFNPTG